MSVFWSTATPVVLRLWCLFVIFCAIFSKKSQKYQWDQRKLPKFSHNLEWKHSLLRKSFVIFLIFRWIEVKKVATFDLFCGESNDPFESCNGVWLSLTDHRRSTLLWMDAYILCAHFEPLCIPFFELVIQNNLFSLKRYSEDRNHSKVMLTKSST